MIGELLLVGVTAAASIAGTYFVMLDRVDYWRRKASDALNMAEAHLATAERLHAAADRRNREIGKWLKAEEAKLEAPRPEPREWR